MSTINILLIEDDAASQTALRQVLDSEDWRLQIVSDASTALQGLAADDWTLVIVNVEDAAAAPPEVGTKAVKVLA